MVPFIQLFIERRQYRVEQSMMALFVDPVQAKVIHRSLVHFAALSRPRQ
jgi:hypothetical protein